MWSSASLGTRAWRGYLNLLQRRPLTTKCVTSGIIMVAGDAIQQAIEHRARQQDQLQEWAQQQLQLQHKTSAAASAALSVAHTAASPVSPVPATTSSPSASPSFPPPSLPSFVSSYDVPRSLRSGLFGALAVGPIFHVWFRRLDIWFPGSAWKPVSKKLALDQLVMAPLFTSFYFVAMGGMEQRSSDEIARKVSQALWPTLLANWAIFPLAQGVNFAFVPERLRVLVLNAGGLVYNVYLSKYNAAALAEEADAHHPHVSAVAVPVATAAAAAVAPVTPTTATEDARDRHPR
jgi:hypothetical protein